MELELLSKRLYNPRATNLQALCEDVLHEALPKVKSKGDWMDELTDERKTCEYEYKLIADSQLSCSLAK